MASAISGAPIPAFVIPTNMPPCPAICAAAEMSPSANAPWPATMAVGAAGSPGSSGAPSPPAELLIVLLQVLAHVRRLAHAPHQPLVERVRGVHPAVAQQVVHRDHLGDHRDVLSRVERHADLRERDAEDLRRLAVEPRAVHDLGLVPLLELHHHLDALLLTHGADAEDGRDVHEPDAAHLHVMPLQLVPAADHHVAPATGGDHQVVGHEAVAALDEVEHAL